MSDAVQQVFSEAIHAAIPDTQITGSEWADVYRYVAVGPEAGAHWRTSRVPYLKEILDCSTDRNVREIVWWSASRVAKTEGLLNNIIGRRMHVAPGPIGLVQPTLDMAKKYSRDRLATMIASTPILTDLVEDPRTRDSGNTLLYKAFPNGHISIIGANSPIGLASEDFQTLLLDEVDRFPLSLPDEGDPVELARVRTTNFEAYQDSLVVMTSSPTIKGRSRIEKAYLESDQRQFYVPCTRCGEFQLLIWANVIWKELDRPPEKACYRCPLCSRFIEHEEKTEMLQLGEWRAHAEFSGVAGFKLPGLYSPWTTWGQMATILTDAKRTKNIPKLQVWTNTRLGELWEEGDGVEVDEVKFLREEYKAELPAGVLLVDVGVDTQDDRLEAETFGWGLNGECWSIDFQVFRGDPSQVEKSSSQQTVWDDLEDYLTRDWRHELGVTMRPRIVCIDRRGHHTDAVDKFCKRNTYRAWVPVMGSSIPGKPIAPLKPTRVGRQNVNVYTIGTEAAKDAIAAALKIARDPKTGEADGQGLCHFPEHYEYDYFDQLCAERAITRYHRGYTNRAWELIKKGSRNEALDRRVYALAGKEILKPNFKKLHERLLERVQEAQSKPGGGDSGEQDGAGPITPPPPAVAPPPRVTGPVKFRMPSRRR